MSDDHAVWDHHTASLVHNAVWYQMTMQFGTTRCHAVRYQMTMQFGTTRCHAVWYQMTCSLAVGYHSVEETSFCDVTR